MLVSHLILPLGKCPHAELIFSFYLILAIYAHILVSRRQHELILAIYAHILGTHAGLSSHFTSW